MARRTIPLLIAFVVGWVLIISSFMPAFEGWGEDAAIGFDILAAIAFVLGGGNLLKVHASKVKKQIPGWGYSTVTLFFFILTLGVGLLKIGGIPSKKYPFGLQISNPQNPLVWLIESERYHVASLADGEALVIGSADGSDLQLTAPGVAPQHCQITRKGDGYELTDLGSAMGTYLGASRVEGTLTLEPGDRFRVGTVGDPIVAFRTGDSLLYQVPRPDDPDAPLPIHGGSSAHIHLMGNAVGGSRQYLDFHGDGVQLHVGDAPEPEEGNATRPPDSGGRVLAAGDTFSAGDLQLVFRPNGRLTGEYNERDKAWFWFLYQYAFKPLQQAVFAMLAFYVASAAFRAFRAKNVEAIILLGTAFLILLGRTYLGTWVTAWVPEEHSAWTVPNITVWIMQVINSAGNRAIMIGIALGIASTSLRVILGIDRSYLGGEGD